MTVQGLTVLVGRSNLGKSALVRAVRALQLNQPGEAFVRKGAPHAEVCLETPDGSVIEWRKGGGHNAYRINGVDYLDVGRGAPEAVAAAGWGDLPVGEGEDPLSVQVADQFEPLFLLDRKGSYAAKVLSDVEQVERLQACLTASEKDRRAARATLKVRSQDLASVQSDLAALSGLPDLEEALACAEEAAVVLRQREEAVRVLEAATLRARTLASKLEEAEGRLRAAELAVDRAEEAAASLPPPEAATPWLTVAPELAARARGVSRKLRLREDLLASLPDLPEPPAPPALLGGGAQAVMHSARRASSALERKRALLTRFVLPPEPPPPPPILTSAEAPVRDFERVAASIRRGLEARNQLKLELDTLASQIAEVEAAAPPCPTCGRLTPPSQHLNEEDDPHHGHS